MPIRSKSARSYPNSTTGMVGDPKTCLAQLVAAISRPARDRGFAEARRRGSSAC